MSKKAPYCSSKIWVFDCDGVLLDSNKIKTEAFRELALEYKVPDLEGFVEFHRRNGGMSRFLKIETLLRDYLQQSDYQEELKKGVDRYGHLVRKKLSTCAEGEGLRDFLNTLPKDSQSYVISGALETEVQEVLEEKDLASYFKEIYGSPLNKIENLQKLRKLTQSPLGAEATFIGDSITDYKAAKEFGMNFIFFYGLTEWDDWETFFKDKEEVLIAKNFEDLLSRMKKRAS